VATHQATSGYLIFLSSHSFLLYWFIRFKVVLLRAIFFKRLPFMIRSIYTPNSNSITVPIPDRYIGTALEVNVFPVIEIYTEKTKAISSTSTDLSFGAWSDMEKTDTDICADIRSSRYFSNRETAL
jgi:hypothetical protein